MGGPLRDLRFSGFAVEPAERPLPDITVLRELLLNHEWSQERLRQITALLSASDVDPRVRTTLSSELDELRRGRDSTALRRFHWTLAYARQHGLSLDTTLEDIGHHLPPAVGDEVLDFEHRTSDSRD